MVINIKTAETAIKRDIYSMMLVAVVNPKVSRQCICCKTLYQSIVTMYLLNVKMFPYFNILCLKQVQKSVVRSMLHVGGCSLHTEVSFSTHRSCWQTLFSPWSSACVSIHITHLQVHRWAPTHTNTQHALITQRQLIWSGVCTLCFKGDFTLMFGLDESCCVRLFPQQEHCSLKQLSFWLIQNRWHVHVGLLGCMYVRAGGCV